MIRFGNVASYHSGLIPLKTAYKKRGELLLAIASKKNFIKLHSAAFVTVFAPNLVHAYIFRIFLKSRSINCFQVSTARVQLAKEINLFQKELSINFQRNIRNMPIIGFCHRKQ